MSTGKLEAMPGATHDDVRRRRPVDAARASERGALHARLRTEILPALEQLDDPGRDAAELIALAGVEGRRLRAALERPEADPQPPARGERHAREAEHEWVRGHLHDTALQILEFIAGDGFGTGLTAEKISHLAGGAARDLRRWLDAGDVLARSGLVPELQAVTHEASELQLGVRLVVGEIVREPTGEQVAAIAGAVREAMTNARKHAHATEVVVHVASAGDGRTAVTVTDDGIGFDAEAALEGRGLGVRHSIVGRMRRVGGGASLESRPGGGTRVTLVTAGLP